MRRIPFTTLIWALVCSSTLVPLTAGEPERGTSGSPRAVLRPAPLLRLPEPDVPRRDIPRGLNSNSPLHWDGDNLYIFGSSGRAWRTSGPDLGRQGNRIAVDLGWQNNKMNLWLESTWKDEDGTLYAAFHYEPVTLCISNSPLPTAPRIGWLRSYNNGATWDDLGFIVSAEPCRLNCQTRSPWYAGGTGDFAFLLDERKEHFYIYGTSYDPDLAEQGVFAARLAYADRDQPTGKAQKWHRGAWSEPGVWGHVTPVFPPERNFHLPGGTMFWGPAIHWNTYLQMYVMILSRGTDSALATDGVYVSYNRDLANPAGWSRPERILDRAGILQATAIGKPTEGRLLIPAGVDGSQLRPAPDGSLIADTTWSGWYPQVVGTEQGETDKRCGRTCRLFMNGQSRLEIEFQK